jgi:hypothetical protein
MGVQYALLLSGNIGNYFELIFRNLIDLGNWDTLEVKAKEKGLDTRHELIKFYDAHYSANLMQLVVYGKGLSSNCSAFPYILYASKDLSGSFPSHHFYICR